MHGERCGRRGAVTDADRGADSRHGQRSAESKARTGANGQRLVDREAQTEEQAQ